MGAEWVVNVGSLSRGSLVQDDMDRKPCAIEMDFTDGINFVRHDLEIPSADEIFDVQGRERAEMRESVMEDFVSALSQSLVLDNEENTLESVVAKTDVPDIVRERALRYLELV